MAGVQNPFMIDITKIAHLPSVVIVGKGDCLQEIVEWMLERKNGYLALGMRPRKAFRMEPTNPAMVSFTPNYCLYFKDSEIRIWSGDGDLIEAKMRWG